MGADLHEDETTRDIGGGRVSRHASAFKHRQAGSKRDIGLFQIGATVDLAADPEEHEHFFFKSQKYLKKKSTNILLSLKQPLVDSV